MSLTTCRYPLSELGLLRTNPELPFGWRGSSRGFATVNATVARAGDPGAIPLNGESFLTLEYNDVMGHTHNVERWQLDTRAPMLGDGVRSGRPQKDDDEFIFTCGPLFLITHEYLTGSDRWSMKCKECEAETKPYTKPHLRRLVSIAAWHNCSLMRAVRAFTPEQLRMHTAQVRHIQGQMT